MKIYPAIDLMQGRVVRLTQGLFDSATEYTSVPAEMARSFAKAGASNLHLVDLDGAREGTVKQASIFRDIVRESHLRVQVGGGIRTLSQALAYLESGASRVVIGSLAVRDPSLMEQILKTVGPTHITLAVDFRRDAQGQTPVVIQGWKESTGIFAPDLMQRYLDLGVQNFLCTDVGRDGTLVGPDVTLYQQWQQKFPTLEIQVSGGIGSLLHLNALKATGTKAVIVGKALYEGKFRLEEALKC